MFKAERLQRIKSLVCEQKQVDVATLSKILNVTEVTVRSDLEQLEKTGFLKRLHGGAVLNEIADSEQEINELLRCHTIIYNQAKETAAKIAAQLVQENDRIFLGPGETCYYIAKELLRAKQLTVLTNNLYVANILSPNMHINLILTGGQLLKDRYCVSSDMFRNTIEDLFFTKAFFSIAGVDLTAGYTVDSSQELAIFREIGRRCQQIVLTVDSQKFDNISFVKLGGLDIPLTLATDMPPPKPYADYYRQHGIEVHAAIM